MKLNSQYDLKKKLLKVVFESSLIIFSVLLALTVNEYRSEINANQKKERALAMIKAEISYNLAIVKKSQPYHVSLYKKFEDSIASFDENHQIEDTRHFILNHAHNSFINDFMSRSAWQTLTQTNTAINFDLEILGALSNVYILQEVGVEKTALNLVSIMRSRETVRSENLKESLYLIKNTLQELASQEEYLHQYYQMTLEKLDDIECCQKNGVS